MQLERALRLARVVLSHESSAMRSAVAIIDSALERLRK